MATWKFHVSRHHAHHFWTARREKYYIFHFAKFHVFDTLLSLWWSKNHTVHHFLKYQVAGSKYLSCDLIDKVRKCIVLVQLFSSGYIFCFWHFLGYFILDIYFWIKKCCKSYKCLMGAIPLMIMNYIVGAW